MRPEYYKRNNVFGFYVHFLGEKAITCKMTGSRVTNIIIFMIKNLYLFSQISVSLNLVNFCVTDKLIHKLSFVNLFLKCLKSIFVT